MLFFCFFLLLSVFKAPFVIQVKVLKSILQFDVFLLLIVYFVWWSSWSISKSQILQKDRLHIWTEDPQLGPQGDNSLKQLKTADPNSP